MKECYLEDDGGPQLIAVEEQGPEGCSRQSLWVRIGPVFRDSSQADMTPGVWIQYQTDHMNSGLAGPVLLTPSVWRQLADAVDARLEERGC